MVNVAQTTVETVTTNNNDPCTNMGNLVKKITVDKLVQALPSISSTTIKELSNSKINNIIIGTFGNITKSTVAGDTNE
eukprot:5270274-Ditylum_brightwellii.AAC.1